jgi:ABC-type transporter Mla subunit MlaD
MPSIPRMPAFSELVGLLQQQTEALAALPRTMLDLNRSILSLVEVVASARDTLASSQRVSARLEAIVEEMEEPILALKPGLERLAVILDDPAVETVPDTLRKINEDVLPLVHGIRETQGKVNNIATLAEETSARLAGLPGAGFLLGRRARPAATPTEPPVPTATPAAPTSPPNHSEGTAVEFEDPPPV